MRKIAYLIAPVLLLSACATDPSDPNRHAKEIGAGAAAVGALAGAIIGYQGDHSGGALRGALVGGALGAVTGSVTGAYMDKQELEFKHILQEDRDAHNMEVERLKNDNLKITMSSEVSFDYNSSILKYDFRNTLEKIANVLRRYPKTHVEITGHTDNIGSAAFNYRLSEERARAVADYFEQSGIDYRRVTYSGAGEFEPRASNDTEAGRQLNRRVDILIIPDK